MTRPVTSTRTVIGQFSRLQNFQGWVMLAQLKHPYLTGRNTLAGHLIQYSWDLINRLNKPMTFDRFYELLEEQSAVFLETNRIDSRYILKKCRLSKRKTYPYPLYKIEIGSKEENLAVIFPPQGEVYKRKKRGEEDE